MPTPISVSSRSKIPTTKGEIVYFSLYINLIDLSNETLVVLVIFLVLYFIRILLIFNILLFHLTLSFICSSLSSFFLKWKLSLLFETVPFLYKHLEL